MADESEANKDGAAASVDDDARGSDEPSRSSGPEPGTTASAEDGEGSDEASDEPAVDDAPAEGEAKAPPRVDVDEPRPLGPRKLVGVAAAVALAALAWWCSRGPRGGTSGESASSGGEGELREGIGAPMAAARVGGDVIVAGLDAAAKAIRVQRLRANGAVAAERLVLREVAGGVDAEVKVATAGEGVFVTWRGLRAGKLVRQLVTLGADLTPKGEPVDVAATSCATRDAIWFSDGAQATSRTWSGESRKVALPKDKDASLLCGAERAYAVLDDDVRTSMLELGGESGRGAVTVMREDDFGADEQRELAEYTVGDDVGFVRLSGSGALALREWRESRELTQEGAQPLRRLTGTIGRDQDVVAVDASPKVVVIVYTEDVVDAGPSGQGEEGAACTRVSALRVDRQTFEESTIELSPRPARCGYEVGPFFTSAVGDDVSVAWVERAGGAGHARAPITSLAHAMVTRSGAPRAKRIEQAAAALVDAGCEADHDPACFAVALVYDGDDPKAPGVAKVLRYP